ncbi:uncharacterized protein [Haliotis cracherodii]|uniref:uncharacterized protein n=1 Tax=Haliotis cracherodii TaxID=6455 RepID=UPI0039ED1417
MGCLCSCLLPVSNPDASSKTPLLSGTTSPPNNDSSNNGLSARQNRPRRKEFLTSVEELANVHCSKLPLPALDKTFQDHSKLYNDLLESFNSLKDTMHDFKAVFEYETRGIPVLAECMKLLRKRCGSAALSASRTRFSITIEYDRQEVSRMCKGPAEDTLEALDLFNKANKLTRSILEKAPKVKNTIQVVLDDEQSLRREISKSKISSTDEPEAMKMCVANINKLRKLPGSIETIQKHTQRQFNEIKESSKALFEES